MGEEMVLAAFRPNARQSFYPVKNVAFAASGREAIELPHVGLLSKIFLTMTGTQTLSGAGALADRGPWDLMKRIRVESNQGALALFDCSGYGAFLVSGITERGWRPDLAGAGSTTPDADIYAAPVASGANVWSLTWIIPISANGGTNFDTGLINLQSPDLTVTVNLEFGAVLDASTLATGFVGTVQVGYEYFEMPNPNEVALPAALVVRCLESDMAVVSVGGDGHIYPVPRQGTLLQMFHVLTLNSVRITSAVDNMIIRLNVTQQLYKLTRREFRVKQRYQTGIEWPLGVFLWDFFHAEEGVSEGDLRDAIDTEQISTTESVIQIASGATLGALGTNKLTTIRRIANLLQ